MADIRISQLPLAPNSISGSELVPIVQNGQTVQTTVTNLVNSPVQTQTFLTSNNEPSLANSRRLGGGLGVGVVDGGPQSQLSIYLNNVSGSLENASTGIIVKNSSTTVINRSIVSSGSGLSVTNGNGLGGNPSVGLTGLPLALSGITGTGFLTTSGGTTLGTSVITGTSNQITVVGGDGSSIPTISIADNPIIGGAGSITIPNGTTGQRLGSYGALRYNTSTGAFEGFITSGWQQFSLAGGVNTFSAGATGFTPNTPTSGSITLAGTLVPANGGTGATTLTGYVYGNGTSTMTASTTIPTTALSGTITNAQLANSSVTYNGVTVALGASGTITAVNPFALTIGTGLSGTSYNGSTAVTIAIDSTVATLTGIQTLTNKSISGSTNTFSNIPNVSLTNSSLTIGTTNIALGGTSLTLGGLTSVTVTQDPTTGLQLATKQYVDAIAQGLNTKAAVLVATTVNITLSGEQTIDGVTTSASRVLVKNQTTQANNGIYLSGTGAWTRTADANTWNQLISAYVFVETGTTQADTGWVCTVDPGGTLGVTAVTWAQFSGAGTYTAGTGLTLTGTVFSLTAPVTTALGGTGSTSALTQYGVVYGSTTSVMATTSAGTSTQVLHGNASGAPTWGAVSLTADVSGILPIANGGTGVATLTGLAYGNGTSAFTAATAAQVVAVISTTAVTNATNATNLALTAGSGATNYITYAATATGNVPQYTSTGLTFNATNTAITGGINGGTF